jgi:hypothetical protein
MSADRLFSYKMTVDAGFAPNPWWGYLTLATCKPKIRQAKQVGDWIAGFTSGYLCGDQVGQERLIYLMQVGEKLSIAEYFRNQKFKNKKPNPQASDFRKRLGDNVYAPLVDSPASENDFRQIDDFCHGPGDKHRDLSGLNVLVAKRFVYFGKNALVIPASVRPEVPKGQSAHGSQTHDSQRVAAFLDFVSSRAGLDAAVAGGPHHWPEAVALSNERINCRPAPKQAPPTFAPPSKPRC